MKEKVRLVQSIILVLTCLGVTLATWLGAANSIEIKNTVMALGGICVFSLGVIRVLFSGEFYVSKKENGIVAALLVFIAISILLNSPPVSSVMAWLLVCLLFYALFDLFNHGDTGRLFLAGVLASLGVTCLWGLAQVLGIDPTPWGALGRRVFGSRVLAGFGNPNFFAGFLILTLPLAGFQIFQTHRRRYRLLGGGLWLLGTFLLLRTGSKAGFLALVFQFFLLGHLAWRSNLERARRVRFLKVWLAAGVAGLGLALVALPPDLMKRIQDLFSGSNESVVFRLNTWAGAWKMFLAAPLFGHGPGSFPLLFPGFRPESAMAGSAQHAYEVTHAENWVLQMACEIGLAGLVAFCVLVFFTLKPLREAAKHLGEGDNWAPALATGLLIGLSGCLVENLAALDLFLPSTAFFFTGLTAMGMARYSGMEGTEPLRFKPKPPLAIIFTLFVIALAVHDCVRPVNMLEASIQLKRAEDLSGAGRFKEAIPIYIDSMLEDSENLETLYFLGSANFDSGNMNGAETWWNTLQKNAPDYILIHDKMARLYQKTGRFDKAEAEWRRQVRIDPYYLAAWSDLAKMLYEQRRPEEALSVLDQALKKIPNELSLKNNRGILLFQMNHLAEAKEAFEEVLKADPNQTDARNNLAVVSSRLAKQKRGK